MILERIARNFSGLPSLRLVGRTFTPTTLSDAVRSRIEAGRRARQEARHTKGPKAKLAITGGTRPGRRG